MATVVVAGQQSSAAPLPRPLTRARDLRGEALTGQRTLTLAMGGMGGMGGGMGFTIDGKSFDAARVDQNVPFGGIEQWTIVNTSPIDHPFHLHVWPMQVISIGPNVTSVPTWQDVVNVPSGGSTVVRIAFEDFPGTAVFHCHILDHEDNGMMGIISVT